MTVLSVTHHCNPTPLRTSSRGICHVPDAGPRDVMRLGHVSASCRQHTGSDGDGLCTRGPRMGPEPFRLLPGAGSQSLLCSPPARLNPAPPEPRPPAPRREPTPKPVTGCSLHPRAVTRAAASRGRAFSLLTESCTHTCFSGPRGHGN